MLQKKVKFHHYPYALYWLLAILSILPHLAFWTYNAVIILDSAYLVLFFEALTARRKLNIHFILLLLLLREYLSSFIVGNEMIQGLFILYVLKLLSNLVHDSHSKGKVLSFTCFLLAYTIFQGILRLFSQQPANWQRIMLTVAITAGLFCLHLLYKMVRLWYRKKAFITEYHI